MSTNEIDVNAVNARAREEQTPMTKIPSVEEKHQSKDLAEAAVVGDWLEEFDKRFEINLDGEPATGMTTVTCYEAEIKTFITTLLAAKDREIEEAMQAQVDLGEALLDMYSQYCQDGHSFMSAGEQASALLEHYGYGSFDEIGRIITPTK